MSRTWLTLLVWLALLAPSQAENLARNPSFEVDSGGKGEPDQWRMSGDSRLVEQSLTLDAGRDGSRCARLACTRYQAGNPAAHAMICQLDIPVRRGVGYRVSFWAKGEGIADQVVSVGLSDTSVWADCGLQDSFVPTSQWTRFDFVFRASRDCVKGSRFQIWFLSTGTLWLDDVVFEEAGDQLYRPGAIVAAAGRRNLVPNASFECGSDGWGSAEWDRTAHWGGPMNRLFGQLDSERAYDGQTSLRMELNPDNQPVSFFDYYELHRSPVRAPLAGNQGFLEVEPGQTYTLSAYLRAAEEDTPALLAVRQFGGGSQQKQVRVGRDWQRFALTFKPASRWCYVLAGPDLRPSPDRPAPPAHATVWLDAVQLERANAPSDFQTSQPIEIGLSTDKLGNVFDWKEPLRIRLTVSSEPDGLRPARVQWRIVDFFDRELRSETIGRVAAGDTVIEVPPEETLRGFLRFHARLTAGELVSEHTMRMAAIPVNRSDDSRFGVNHAYPWPHLLDLCRQAGLVWMRDWSLKWQDVEPEKGRFTFTEPDYQIDRPLKHGLQVLGLLPFPSSNWSSSAPASVQAGDRYPENRQRAAHAPRDLSEFENYVAQTVTHYRGRVPWWQVFNEPLFTDYSLPRKLGYDGTTYATHVKAFAHAARQANAQARVLAGIGYLSEGQILEDFEKFFAAGGLAAADAIDIHHYPRLRPPEFFEGPLQKLNALMDQHGGRKPIWLTEYGYYADDDPATVPLVHHGFNQPLAGERQQSEYAVRWAVLNFANGVDKIFYHAGTCDGLNQDSLQGIFFEYGGTPHKIYAAQAVMAHFLTPASKFVGRLTLASSIRAYLFRDGDRLVCVVWADHETAAQKIALGSDKVSVFDLMGRPMAGGRFTPSSTPVYVTTDGLTDDEFWGAVKD
ncbi:MAG TPA: carbohydrate binding domain-containing protein [Candidatus Anammoximicrobium sp.]|nr:carbohydrate binding domain-containing protein [Candidatus Anammoximicrobium sp.]